MIIEIKPYVLIKNGCLSPFLISYNYQFKRGIIKTKTDDGRWYGWLFQLAKEYKSLIKNAIKSIEKNSK